MSYIRIVIQYSLQTLTLNIDDKSRVCLTETPGVEGSDYINASFIDVREIHTCSIDARCFDSGISYRAMVKRIMAILQHKVSCYSINPHFCCYPHRTSGGISGEVLEYGVAVQVTNYCHAH